MDKEYINILIFAHKSSPSRHLKIKKKVFKVILYLSGFLILCLTFFFCDYIQVKKKAYEVAQLRQQTETQRTHLHFFSSKIEDLEKQISKLKEFDKRIRIIANLEKSQDVLPFMGMGGPSPSDIRDRLRIEKDEKGLIKQMRIDIERLESEATTREESLSELEKLLQTKKDILAHTPSIWPAYGWVTSGFGFRTNPFTGLTQMHEGIDIANQTGTPVVAPANGYVSDIQTDNVHGKLIIISHGFGMTTRYSHLNKIFVRVGQKVKRGEKIAEIGMTGKTTGPHLHYEVRLNGIPVNPKKYILN
ncbi:MAG: peptidoglycan DD-metalloendopeptidase family protein [Thermodesulfobacteriota bacterium]